MEILPKFGIGKLLFGMKPKDVEAVYGKPDKRFNDEEHNDIWLYNMHRMRLTFYEDEDFRFGYAISSNPELELFDNRIIGMDADQAKALLKSKGFKTWEKEDFDMTENHFNEDNWTTLLAEFGHVVKIEIGAVIKSQDDFDWKFPTGKK